MNDMFPHEAERLTALGAIRELKAAKSPLARTISRGRLVIDPGRDRFWLVFVGGGAGIQVEALRHRTELERALARACPVSRARWRLEIFGKHANASRQLELFGP